MSDSKADETGEHDPVEIEWQFDALDLRPVERWLATLPTLAIETGDGGTITALARPPRRLVDSYLDSEDWRIARAGFVVRTRRRGRHDEITLKDSRPAEVSGLRHRLEVTEVLPPSGLDALGDRRTRRATSARHRRLAPLARGPPGPHAPASVRVADRRSGRGGDRVGRHHDRRRHGAAPHAAAAGRGRGPSRLARGTGADRGAVADVVRAPTGASVQVRGRSVGTGRGDPGHAGPRADRRVRLVHHGRARLRGTAAPTHRATGQRARDAARRGS